MNTTNGKPKKNSDVTILSGWWEEVGTDVSELNPGLLQQGVDG